MCWNLISLVWRLNSKCLIYGFFDDFCAEFRLVLVRFVRIWAIMLFCVDLDWWSKDLRFLNSVNLIQKCFVLMIKLLWSRIRCAVAELVAFALSCSFSVASVGSNWKTLIFWFLYFKIPVVLRERKREKEGGFYIFENCVWKLVYHLLV